MKITTNIQRPDARELFITLPRTLAIIVTLAVIMATILSTALTSIRQTVVYLTPAEHYFYVSDVVIPNVDYGSPKQDFVQFRRVVSAPGFTAEWFSEVVVYNNAGSELCRRSGQALYSSKANESTVVIPVKEWLGKDCRLPPGCYYQDLLWQFEVDGITKTVHTTSNRFAVSTKRGTGVCFNA